MGPAGAWDRHLCHGLNHITLGEVTLNLSKGAELMVHGGDEADLGLQGPGMRSAEESGVSLELL